MSNPINPADPPSDEQTPPKKKSVGCPLCLLLPVILLALAALAAHRFAPGYLADRACDGLIDVVKQSALPEHQIEDIEGSLHHFAEEVAHGTVTLQEFARILRAIQNGPLRPCMVVCAIEAGYTPPETVKENRKADKERVAKLARRFQRGILSGKIASKDVDEVLQPITEETSAGPLIRSPLTNSEVSQFISDMKGEVKKAKIPEEDGKNENVPDVAATIKKLIAEAQREERTDDDAKAVKEPDAPAEVAPPKTESTPDAASPPKAAPKAPAPTPKAVPVSVPKPAPAPSKPAAETAPAKPSAATEAAPAPKAPPLPKPPPDAAEKEKSGK